MSFSVAPMIAVMALMGQNPAEKNYPIQVDFKVAKSEGPLYKVEITLKIKPGFYIRQPGRLSRN